MNISAEGQRSYVAADLSDDAYAQIGRILASQQKFCLQGYKDLCIRRRIAARIRSLGLQSTEPYLERLEQDQAEQESLLAALSIHVSHFFRNPSSYLLLQQRALPELLQQARRRKSKLRIWSAGCAGGEEPYSLALLCRSLISEQGMLSILATDLSSRILEQARQGLFPENRLADVPKETLERFFIREDGAYRLCESIRKSVRFVRHDILTDVPVQRVDLVLCRNLLIYFSRWQQQQILQRIAAVLSPGGFLLLGRAETLVPGCRELFQCIDSAERLYQRREDEKS